MKGRERVRARWQAAVDAQAAMMAAVTSATDEDTGAGRHRGAGRSTAAGGRRKARRGKGQAQLTLPEVRKRPGNGGRWGGRRAGAGRKPVGAKAGMSHARRPEQSPRRPLHVTIRLVPGLPRLRRRKGYQLARRALGLANRFPGARICHLSIQANHLHFLVEAEDRAGLSKAMRSFGISFAKNVNGALARRGAEPRRGRVLADRYHVVVLRTPAQTRAALAYVLGNWRRHGEDHAAPRRRTDRYSSGPFFDGWTVPLPPFLRWKDLPWPNDGPLPIRRPRSWLLTTGWRRGGPLSPWERPGPRAPAPPR